jgi:hypothetical protein
MAINNAKTRCPKCGKVYSINDGQAIRPGKRAARCNICDTRFFVDFREDLETADKNHGDVNFLKSYFEKRSTLSRRKEGDRRKGLYDPVLNAFSNDKIPIFSNDGNALIGHISPGRRDRGDRRSCLDRRQSLMEEDHR